MLVDEGYSTQLSCTIDSSLPLSSVLSVTIVHDWYDHRPKCMVKSCSEEVVESVVEKLRNLQDVPTKRTTNADAAHQNGMQ